MTAKTFLKSSDYRPIKIKIEQGLLGFMRQVGQAGLINLAAGVPSPDLLPTAALKDSFFKATKQVGKSMWAYQTPEGHLPLRESMACRLGHRKVTVTGSDVIITTGCTQALHIALHTLVKKGDLVACESPCYYNTLEQIETAGGHALPLPTDPNTGIIFHEAKKLLIKYRPSVLVVCSTLSNPTGATIPEEDRPKWVELAKELNIVILEDDIYAELCEGPIPSPLRAYDDGSTVVYVSSYCKTVSPGLRVGCVLPGIWFEKIVARKCMADMHGSLVSEVTLDSFISSDQLEIHLKKLRKICLKKRGLAQRAIADCFPVGTIISEPRGGFILWVILPIKIDLNRLATQGLSQNVSFASGDAFSCVKPQVSAMRINCAKVSETELTLGLKKLGQLIKTFH